MIKLYGAALSNYFNIVKHNLLEKGVAFEEVMVRPNKEPATLAKSPMGKIPFIETEQGSLAESAAILDYLEERFPQPAMYPNDPFQRAKARELMRMVELYIAGPSHRHAMEVFFGAPRSQSAYAEVKPQVELGVQALARLVHFGPFVQGATFGNADICLFHNINSARAIMLAVYQWDILSAVPGLEQCLAAIGARPTTKTLVAAMEAARAAMLAQQH
ncbi:MAG: glutathione S-transferase family protein [Gammaproteobacteria bacterium]|nr:glutathione S-transferase family protein [Gammaproteobacteria bacterium]